MQDFICQMGATTGFFTKTVFMLLRGDECFSDMQKDGSNIKDLNGFKVQQTGAGFGLPVNHAATHRISQWIYLATDPAYVKSYRSGFFWKIGRAPISLKTHS